MARSTRTQLKDNRGFTMAELLAVIAIISILALIAIPSFLQMQGRMRIFELNNAAESIANAAQVQMTSLKNSGNWWSYLDDGKNETNFPDATPKETGYRYMTASTATRSFDDSKTLKFDMVEELSIEENVRDASYIIEFDPYTACVTRVYYTDGRTGFFDEAHENHANDGAVVTYYEKYGIEDDNQARRMTQTPMIGYYEGTPSGATDSVALQAPSISMASGGYLQVKNPNMASSVMNAVNWKTATNVTITSKSKDKEGLSLTFSGLNKDALYRGVVDIYFTDVNGGENSGAISFNDNELSKVVNSDDDTFWIDLNLLYSTVLSQSKPDQPEDVQEELEKLAKALAQFKADDDILATAEVTIVNETSKPEKDYIPVFAKAYLKWPLKEAKIELYLTDPSVSDGSAKHINHEGYTNPVVGLTDGLEEESVLWNPRTDTYGVETKSSVIKEDNIEATQQKYVGGYVKLSAVRNQKNAIIQATAGAYQPTETSDPHRYQIYEIWLGVAYGGTDETQTKEDKFLRVGYLSQNKWVSGASDYTGDDAAIINNFFDCIDMYSIDGMIAAKDGTSNVCTKVEVRCKDLAERITVSNEDMGYKIYVRTTPQLTEVKDWFSDHITDNTIPYNYFPKTVNVNTTGSRGENFGATIRHPFEAEFGAPSTVSSFVFTKTKSDSVMPTEGTYPDSRLASIRVYYSATPAVAWGNGNYYDANKENEVPSCALWLYTKIGNDYKIAEEEEKEEETGKNESIFCRPAAAGNANLHLIASDTADFELPRNEVTISNPEITFYGHDELFYRLFEYFGFDEYGDLQTLKLQPEYPLGFSPYNMQESFVFAGEGPWKEGYDFNGWVVYKDGSPILDDDGVLKIESGRVGIDGALDALLPYGSVQLVADYKETQKSEVGGLVYIGLNEQGKRTATGYINGKADTARIDAVEVTTDLATGYYFSIDENSGWAPKDKRSDGRALKIGDDTVQLYPATIDEGTAPYKYLRFSYDLVKGGPTEKSRTYYVNPTFAQAVTVSQPTAQGWGSASSPWLIEQPSQYFGALSESKQNFYASDSFKQLNNLDFTESSSIHGVAVEFKGSYDGNNKTMVIGSINGQGTFSALKYDSSQKSYASGLFPLCSGATISNVDVQFASGTHEYSISNGNPITYFGGIVGVAYNKSTITHCTVGSASGQAVLSLNGMLAKCEGSGDNEDYNAAGCIVGRVRQATKVQYCRATNIEMHVNTSDPKGWSKSSAAADGRNYFGGLIGLADISDFNNTNTDILKGLSVNGVTLSSSTKMNPLDSSLICLGGVIGRLYANDKVSDYSNWEWNVANCIIDTNLGLTERTKLNARVYVGSLVGYVVKGGPIDVAKQQDIDFARFYSDDWDFNLITHYTGPLTNEQPVVPDIAEDIGMFYVLDTSGTNSTVFGYKTNDVADTFPITGTALQVGSYYLAVPDGYIKRDSGAIVLEKAGSCVIDGNSVTLYKLSMSSESSTKYDAIKALFKKVDDRKIYQSSYYANFYFAKALTNTTDDADKWGTISSPWEVALGSQFPGALPKAVQENHIEDYFQQTNNISLSDIQGEYIGFQYPFKGNYSASNNETGNDSTDGYMIRDFQNGVSVLSYRSNNNNYTAQGLFPALQGGTVSNVKLPVNDEITIEGGTNTGRFGILAGSVELNGTTRSTIENCEIYYENPSGKTNPDKAKLTVENLCYKAAHIGVIAGYATTSTLTNCVVRDIELDLQFGTGTRSTASNETERLHLGGITGTLNGSSRDEHGIVASCQVQNIQFDIGQVLETDHRLGGLVGWMNSYSEFAETTVDNDRIIPLLVNDVLTVYDSSQDPTKLKNARGALCGYMNNPENCWVVDNQIASRYNQDSFKSQIGAAGPIEYRNRWCGYPQDPTNVQYTRTLFSSIALMSELTNQQATSANTIAVIDETDTMRPGSSIAADAAPEESAKTENKEPENKPGSSVIEAINPMDDNNG